MVCGLNPLEALEADGAISVPVPNAASNCCPNAGLIEKARNTSPVQTDFFKVFLPNDTNLQIALQEGRCPHDGDGWTSRFREILVQ